MKSVYDCPKCGKRMKNQVDSITKKVSPYLWGCECTPDIQICIG